MDNIYKKISKERKELQEAGLIPGWYSTAGLQMFQQKYEYDTQGESVKGQFKRIAKTAAKYLQGTEFEKDAESKFFELFWKGWLSPSTPVLANMGTDRGMSVSCSGGYIEDSVDSFYNTLHETAVLTKNGFGTSGYLGDIRPRGSEIRGGGKASGVVPVLKTYIHAMRDIAQGTSRRGAFAGYLPIDHGDFDEVVDFISAEPDDANIGWNISNSFIEKLNNQDEEAIRRFQRAMKLKMVTGKGYFCFIDKVNNKRPESYKNNNLKVKASNLCVAPETLVLTDVGYFPIADLEDQQVNVWNGTEFSETTVRKTGENQKILKVVTSSGQELECTEYHKWYVKNSYRDPAVEKRTCELAIGDKLIKFELPTIEGFEKLEHPYTCGIFSAEGTYEKGRKKLYLYHGKRNLAHLIGAVRFVHEDEKQNRSCLYLTNEVKDKFFVPTNTYDIQSRLEWFAGLCDGDGTIVTTDGNQALQVTSVEFEFLKQIQLMLQTLGVDSKVTQNTEAMNRMLPANNGTGEKKEYACKASWRLLVTSNGLFHLHNIGLKFHRLKYTPKLPQRDARQFIKIDKILDEGRYSDTYCFTEPKKHMGMFNGLLTGQCDEITLHSDKDHSFTCVLSSMNVYKYSEWKDTDAVYWSTIFLDCVAQDFITKGKGVNGLEKAVRFTEKSRALGLGQCGWHSLCQSKLIDFEGFEAHMLSQEIAHHIHSKANEASKKLAAVFGEPEWCKGTGKRNSHLIAIAPTKSTALLMGGISEGINPDPAMTFTQMTAAGEVERINPILLELMKSKGCYNSNAIKEISEAGGSVQGVSWLTEEEKKAFKTAFEINQKSLVRLASSRSMYVDQWQSLNLFFASDESPEWIAEVHAEAFNDPNILGLYYIYTQAGVKSSKDECVACQ